jgi:hypothetical protein
MKFHPNIVKKLLIYRTLLGKALLSIGPANSMQIPALVALLGSSSEVIRELAQQYLNEVVDTPENIAAAYSHVLTESHPTSQAHKFALLAHGGKSVSSDKNDDTGRATSRWMTRLFESVGYWIGGEEGRRKAGEHYRDHAPRYEWTLGVAGMVVNFGVMNFLNWLRFGWYSCPAPRSCFWNLVLFVAFWKEPKTPIKVSIPQCRCHGRYLYHTYHSYPISDLGVS